jgi:hypothetical protein
MCWASRLSHSPDTEQMLARGFIENGVGEVQRCVYTESASHSINILTDIHCKQYTLSRSCPFTNIVTYI